MIHELSDQIARDYLRMARTKDAFISAACPFHKGGGERRPSFWIDRRSGRWGCFSCSAGGSSLKYLLKDLGVASRSLESRLAIAAEEGKKTAAVEDSRRRKKARSSFKGEYVLPEALLGVYDWKPLDLVDSGFEVPLLRQHDIGYDRARERITFPIRDIYGNLIGISGRTTINEMPKYKVYTGRRYVEGKEIMGELGDWYPGYSSDGVRDHLWRGNFVYPVLDNDPTEQLIIVEGYKAALWLVQHGWLNVVAIMGARMSPAQERLVRRLGVATFVFLDNNEPGHEGAHKICQRLGAGTFPVYRVHYPDEFDEDTQPDDLSEPELEDALSNAKPTGGKHYGQRNGKRMARKKGSRQQKARQWKARR